MPDVVRHDNVASWIAALDARVRKLESYPPGAVTLATRHPFTGSAHSPTTAWSDVAESFTAAFTLYRPRPVLIIATMLYSGSGGTASYVRSQAIITTGPGNGPALDVNGASMADSAGAVTNGQGEETVTALLAYVVPPGTYYAALQASLNAGAGTTMQIDTTYGGELDVFYTSG